MGACTSKFAAPQLSAIKNAVRRGLECSGGESVQTMKKDVPAATAC